MSEERFDRIEERLDRLKTGQKDLRDDLRDVRVDLGGVSVDLNGVRGDLDGVKAGLDGVRVDVDGLRGELRRGLGRIDGRIDDLDRHMHVLHEDVIARIAAIPEYTGPTKAEFGELKDIIGLRLDSLEATVRQHSADIERLK